MPRSAQLLAAVGVLTGVCFAAPALAGAATFSNSGTITITSPAPGCGGQQASPYPSNINVSGQLGAVTDVNVTLNGLTHTFSDDVDVLVVGPAGQSARLMIDTGGEFDVSGVNLTFDDAAATSLPDSTQITSGTYKPTVGNDWKRGRVPRTGELPVAGAVESIWVFALRLQQHQRERHLASLRDRR